MDGVRTPPPGDPDSHTGNDAEFLAVLNGPASPDPHTGNDAPAPTTPSNTKNPETHSRTRGQEAAGRPCTHMPTRSGFWTAPTMKS